MALFKNPFKQKKNIRLAVVGLTSSGKTYLLQDIVTTFYRLGFDSQRLTKSPFSFVGSFIGDGRVGQTLRYAPKKVNHYVGRYDNGDDRFEIEFLDIPGESISDKAIRVFDAVAVSLYNQDNKIYRSETWKKGDSEIKILDFIIQESETTPVATQSPITQSGFKLPETANSGGATSGTIKAGSDITDEARKNLESEGYKRSEPFEDVSGRQVYESFFDYYPDTVMKAIYASWEKLAPEKPDFIDEKEKSFKEIFMDELYARDFYFLMYCTRATDIILCDKMTLPIGIGNTVQPQSSFLGMTRRLRDLIAAHELFNQDAKWYLAFKGVDAVLKQNERLCRWIEHNSVDHNFVYSVVIYALCKKYLCLEDDPDDDDDYKVEEENKLFTDVKSCASLLTSLDDNNRKRRFEIVHDNLSNKNYGAYIRDENEFNVLNDSDDIDNTLKSHIKIRKEVFELIEDSEKNQKYYEALQLPPHVFFIGTPIDRNYNIYGHKVEDAAAFDERVQAPENRLCFGTYQLATDMLLRCEGIESDNNYGKLLNYFFGKDIDD